jgi:ATP-dependent Lhr-like helicase
MEVQGLLMRGSFERPATSVDHDVEWCERRILQRIHKLTIGARRKQVEPVTPATFMRWLLGWQHLAPQTQLAGEEGLLEALTQLEGFEAPAIEWERTLIPARVADYNPALLDRLCLSGAVGWGRVSPHPAFAAGDGSGPRRVIPSNAAPITFYVRDTAEWLALALADQCVEERRLNLALTPEGLRAWELLKMRGACFVEDVQRVLALTRQQTQNALWELAAAGLAAADGFDSLRAMIDPERKPAVTAAHARMRSAAGRWSLFSADIPVSEDPLERARRADAAIESAARMLLARYGVVFRDLVVRESNIPKWGVLLRMLRRLEDRGEVRGGRFVSGFGGEQFALPHAVESLRAARSTEMQGVVTIAGADPVNLAGILIPGERVAAVPGRTFEYREGMGTPSRAIVNELRQILPRRKRPVAPHLPPAAVDQTAGSLRLF